VIYSRKLTAFTAALNDLPNKTAENGNAPDFSIMQLEVIYNESFVASNTAPFKTALQ